MKHTIQSAWKITTLTGMILEHYGWTPQFTKDGTPSNMWKRGIRKIQEIELTEELAQKILNKETPEHFV